MTPPASPPSLLFLPAVISFRNKDFSGQGKRAERELLPQILAKALAPVGDDASAAAAGAAAAGGPGAGGAVRAPHAEDGADLE